MKAQEVKKRLQYQEVFLDTNTNLIPFIIDTAGNLGPEASKFIAIITTNILWILSLKKPL